MWWLVWERRTEGAGTAQYSIVRVVLGQELRRGAHRLDRILPADLVRVDGKNENRPCRVF